MPELLKAIVLGIVEGLTEFLPISSTGHLLIASDLLTFQESSGGTFEIFIQFGAVVALLFFYAGDLIAQARVVTTNPRVRRFWLNIIIAFIPAAVLGLLLRNFIKAVLFGSPVVIALSFIIGGIILIVVERMTHHRPSREVEADPKHSVPDLTHGQALIIGVAQAAALIPGVSRSGATIVGGLLLGLDRASATNFAFYLALPTLGGATLVDLASSMKSLTSDVLALLLVGTVVAGLVAAASVKWLLSYVAHNTYIPFGIYRVIAGAAILGLVAARLV
jgi:undecaprenyl-diphosphatase